MKGKVAMKLKSVELIFILLIVHANSKTPTI